MKHERPALKGLQPPLREDHPAIRLALFLIALKRRLAPPGSMRENLLRKIYARPTSRPRRTSAIDATVVRWHGLLDNAPHLPRPPRVLILKLDHRGDFIVGLRAIEKLRHAFDGATFTLICGSWNAELAELLGWFERIVPFDFFGPTHDGVNPPDDRIEAFRTLDLARFDLAIDLRHDPDTRILLSMVDASFRAGFCAPAEKGGACLDISLPDVERLSREAGTGASLSAEHRLLLLASFVVDVFKPSLPHPARKLVSGNGYRSSRPFAVIAPRAGNPLKCWPAERFAEVAKALVALLNFDIVIVGGPDDASTADAIAAVLPFDRVRNLAGRVPLRDLPNLLEAASLYVGNDSGPTHLASALGLPTVAILSGVANIEVWRPVGPRTAVIAGRTSCSPCWFVDTLQCPHAVACLNAITPETVLDACKSVLSLEPAAQPAHATDVARSALGDQRVVAAVLREANMSRRSSAVAISTSAAQQAPGTLS